MLKFTLTIVASGFLIGLAGCAPGASIAPKATTQADRPPTVVSPAGTANQVEFESAVRRKLQQKVTWRIENESIIAFARRLSQLLNVEVLIDNDALKDTGINPEETIDQEVHDITLLAALNHILRTRDLDWTIRGDAIVFSTPSELEEELSTRVYAIDDLASSTSFRDQNDELIDAIVRFIAPYTWAEAGGGEADVRTLRVGQRNLLIVSQTMQNHWKVEDLLSDLRAAAGASSSPLAPTVSIHQFTKSIPALENPLLSHDDGDKEANGSNSLQLLVPRSPELLAAIARCNQFSLDLFRRTASDAAHNQFISPYSVREVLALAGFGAVGDTERELMAALALPGVRRQAAIEVLSIRSYVAPQASAEAEFLVANGLWTHRTFPVKSQFATLADQLMGATVRVLDFANAAHTSDEINEWANAKTRGKIAHIVDESNIRIDRPLILANAVYFNGIWQTQFDREQSRPGEFHLGNGDLAQVPMMSGTMGARSGAFADAAVRIVELPYRGESKSMVILVPTGGEGALTALEQSLTETGLTDWLKDLQPGTLRVRMPRFSFRADYDLGPALAELGLASAMNPATADFSSISDGRLFVQQIQHSSYIEVDEKGTEAAAATVMAFGGPPIAALQEINVDRPFLLLIRDVPTGCILFVGRVVDPR